MKIEKVIVEINGEKTELTLDQVRELRDELDRILPQEFTPMFPVLMPYPVPYRPIWQIDQPGWPYPTIICGEATC